MHITHYTWSIRAPMIATFICEKCHQQNKTACYTEKSASKDYYPAPSKGTVFWDGKKKYPILLEEAQKTLDYVHENMKTNEQKKKTLANMGLLCQCENCGHIPTWAGQSYRKQGTIGVIIGILALISLMILVVTLEEQTPWKLPIFWVQCGIFILLSVGSILCIKWRSHKIDKLDPMYLPDIEVSKDASKYADYAPTKICSRCGASCRAGETICHECGKKFDGTNSYL